MDIFISSTFLFTAALCLFEVIGIIRKKSLIKELVAECLAYCQERKREEVGKNAFYFNCAFHLKNLNLHWKILSLILLPLTICATGLVR